MGGELDGGLAPIADKLMADVEALDKRIADLTLPPEKVVGGAAALMEEVAATKISGEEAATATPTCGTSRRTPTAPKKIFELVEPLIQKQDPPS